MYDVVIIGKGPAGVTAAVYAKRANLNVCVIGRDGGALEKTDKIENYYGFEKPIPGKELIQRGIKQAENLEIEVLTDEVVDIQYEKNFRIVTRKETIQSKAVILATGTNRAKPDILGTEELEGRGISYCAICDAFFYRGKNVAVLGNGDYAFHEMQQLLPVVNSITMLTNGEKNKIEYRSESVKIEEKPIKEFRGETQLQNVVFQDESILPIDGVFIAQGIASSVDFARKLGANIMNGNIVIDANMATNIPGLFAAGDCTGGMLQISKAVYEGAKAGTEVIKWMRKEKEKCEKEN